MSEAVAQSILFVDPHSPWHGNTFRGQDYPESHPKAVLPDHQSSLNSAVFAWLPNGNFRYGSEPFFLFKTKPIGEFLLRESQG